MAKDNKALLKSARALFKEKEYNTVIQICKNVLKEDKCNYNALVLMGAAMREVNDLHAQVPATLKKATNVQPDNPLAWHGLLVHFEGQSESIEKWTELVPIINKLLLLESDSTKLIQYSKTLSSILLKLNNDDAVSTSILTFVQLKQKQTNDDNIKIINEVIAKTLTQYPKVINNFNSILADALESVIKDKNSSNKREYYKKYLKLLYKLEQFDKLFSVATEMLEMFTEDIYPLEWICRVYSEYRIIHDTSCNIDITTYYETLLDHDSHSILGYFAQAVHLYETQNLIDSRNILNDLVNIQPKWFHAWLLLVKINSGLYCWKEVETAVLHAQGLIPEGDPNNLRQTINLLLLEALVKSSDSAKQKKAEESFEELSDNSVKSSILRVRLHVLLKKPDAEDLISELQNNLETNVEGTILNAINLLQKGHLEEAADVIGSFLETSESWFILGKIHWHMADYGHSLMAFLNSIRADPNNWECLLYLGSYYETHTKDYLRSIKCYQKILQINPNCEEAWFNLSSVYRHLKDTKGQLEFLQQLTSQGKGPTWAMIQLGLHYLDNDNVKEAVSVFRNAVKSDPLNRIVWECLADAYLARGSHVSAIKSYMRASELNEISIYSEIQLSNIEQLIGEYDVAKDHFVRILEKDKDNLAAMKGLADCYFNLGKKHATAHLYSLARDHFQESMDSIVKAIMHNSEFVCTWKTLGDICYNIVGLPEKYCFLDVIPELVDSESKNSKVKITKKEILSLSIRCFFRAISISEESSLLWYDLACCYMAQYHLDSSINHKEVIHKSLAAAKEAVKLEPNSWLTWNILGIICMAKEIKNYALAQHCFVMAIEKETDNSISWTNLGTLYLLLDNPYRANEAFSWAQKTDPAYINCWIGQAFIAEELSVKDAMDLFRHATQLGYHNEAARGYAHWVIKTIMDPEARKDSLYSYIIEKLHALTVAADQIHWYTVHVPCDPHALNIYGLLLERQKLYKPSNKRFTTALEYVNNNKQRDLVNINLARIHIQEENYKEAVQQCGFIESHSFVSQCQLAISLFKAEMFKESYEAYEAALHWSGDTDSDKAHVLCAMAAMAYMFQESNDTKTLLYQAVSIKPPIISGLLALAALGMLDGDKNLTNLVLKELKSHDNHLEYKNHIAKITAYSYLIQNDMEGASKVICKYIHRYPDSSELWTTLARILLIMSDISFNKCVDKALFLGKNTDSEHIAKITCMSSLSKLITLSPQEGLRCVLNTVHSLPANVDSWSNLITALLPRWSKTSQFHAHWLMVLASRVRNSLVCTRSMEQWLLKNEKQANDIAYSNLCT